MDVDMDPALSLAPGEEVTEDWIISERHLAESSDSLHPDEEVSYEHTMNDPREGGVGPNMVVGDNSHAAGDEMREQEPQPGENHQDVGTCLDESQDSFKTEENVIDSQHFTENNVDYTHEGGLRNSNGNNAASDINGQQEGVSVRNKRSNKKHVAWQADRDLEANPHAKSSGDSDPNAACVNVVAGEQADRRSSPCSPTFQNEELTEPENSPITIENENVCLSAQRNNEIRDLKGDQTYNADSSVLQSTNTENTGGPEPRFSRSSLLTRRRPTSASEVTKREGRFRADVSVSEEFVVPVSVEGFRRLSLPLDFNQPSNKTEHEAVSKLPTRSNLTASVQDTEKGNKKTVFFTYGDQEQVKDPTIESNPIPVTDQSPPSSSRSRQKPCGRPHTAGAARSPRVRPRVERRMIHSAPARTASGRPWEHKFSKEELQRALPRRHFFSCHTKALKDAGFHVEEENARPRRRRLLFFHHDDEPEENTKPAAPPDICVPQATDADGQEMGEDPGHTGLDNTLETAVHMLSLNERAKRRKSHLPQVVECKPLQQYLSYVSENPGEYRHMEAKSCSSGPAAALHPSSHPADNCHTARLVSMGRIFQEKHGGPRKTDEVLRAVYSLNPRDADPYRFAKPSRDKSPLVPGLAARKQTNFPRKESAVSSHSGGGGGGGEDGSKSGQRSKPGSEMMHSRHEAEKPVPTEHLTEMEKRRLKAEEWARSVTTEQMVRAKLHVLKELGHEEQELSQWWLAFRTCSYLRNRIRE